MASCPVIILAAGTSRRMGERKPFIKLPSGITLLEHLLNLYQRCDISEIIVVFNNDGYNFLKENYASLENNARIVINPFPEKGRFLSIQKAVSLLTKDDSCFIHNVDNPFISPDLIQSMKKMLLSDSYVCPTYKGKGGHPVLIGSKIVTCIQSLSDKDRDFKQILNSFNRIECATPYADVCLNLNTPDDINKMIH